MDRGTLRRLLSPGWIVLHIIALASLVALVGLGRWQWQRGSDLGRIQNYSYALEWWLFAAFAVFLWVKTMADSLEDAEASEDVEVTGGAAHVPPEPEPEIEDDDDPELAAYNRHLRALHARSQDDRS